MRQSTEPETILLAELAERIGAQLTGDGNRLVTGVNTIADAAETEVCFLSSEKHAQSLSSTKAAAAIVNHAMDVPGLALLVVDNVDRGLIAALTFFAPRLKGFEGIHPTAVVEPDAEIAPSVVVGPGAYVGHGAKVSTQTVIGHGCFIGENTTIGANTRLDSHVVVQHNCQIGNFCVIQANSTIGSTGFGYSFIDGQHRLIPHNGGVLIEDGVEIGANSCIDRAKFGNTVIGAGTKIDNLVQVAHNVEIGKLCLLAGHVGIAGSTKIGNGVVFGGAAGSSDNLTIGDGAMLGKQTAASRDVPAGQKLLGVIPQEFSHELKCMSVYRRLPELAKELKQLHKKIEKLDAAKDDKN